MKRLIQFSVRIPGEWMDVWLYKGSVLLWSPDGHIYWLSLDDLTTEVAQQRGAASRLLSEYLIFRNDWKVGEQFRSFQRIDGLVPTLVNQAVGEEETTVFESSLNPSPIPNTDRIEGYLLDIAVTGNRIFSATTEGLFETEFNPEFPETENDTVRNVEGRVNSVAINGSRAAIAMEEAGLRTGEIEFGGGRDWASQSTSFEIIDEYAINASYSSYNLLNYNGEKTPEFLRAKKTHIPATGKQAFGRTVIVEHEKPVSIAAPLAEAALSTLRKNSRIEVDDLYVVGNSNFRLLVSDGVEYAAVINLGWGSPAERRGIAPNREFKQSDLDAKSIAAASTTQELKSGFVLEGFDYLGLMTEHGLHQMPGEAVLRTRTFPRSRRHADSYAVVRNHHVDLVGFLELNA